MVAIRESLKIVHPLQGVGIAPVLVVSQPLEGHER
jgi:hypothetical protein